MYDANADKKIVIDNSCNISDRNMKHIGSVRYNSYLNKVCPIFVGSCFKTSLTAIKQAKKYKTMCYAGIHPCDASRSKGDIKKIHDLITENKETIIAIGECGLDYDRLHYSDKDSQLEVFEQQVMKFRKFNLPLFFHNRGSSTEDFLKIIDKFPAYPDSGIKIRGLVHSFTGSVESASQFLERGFYIGLNGKSININVENDYELIKKLPLNRIIVGSDAPYCKFKHYLNPNLPVRKIENHVVVWNEKLVAGSKQFERLNRQVKIPNEPAKTIEVVEAVAFIKGLDVNDVKAQILVNCQELFGEKFVGVTRFLQNDPSIFFSE